MKIHFDGSQGELKRIVALSLGGQELEVICPECSGIIKIAGQRQEPYPALECQSCGKSWQIEAGEQSRRERVWDKFDEWEQKRAKPSSLRP